MTAASLCSRVLSQAAETQAGGYEEHACDGTMPVAPAVHRTLSSVRVCMGRNMRWHHAIDHCTSQHRLQLMARTGRIRPCKGGACPLALVPHVGQPPGSSRHGSRAQQALTSTALPTEKSATRMLPARSTSGRSRRALSRGLE
jgi:hypothetical protein